MIRSTSRTAYEDRELDIARSRVSDQKWSKAKTLTFIIVFCTLAWAGIIALALNLF